LKTYQSSIKQITQQRGRKRYKMEGPGLQTGWTIRGMGTNQVPKLSLVARSISNKEKEKSL
jgi:hypothetical protein